MPERSAGPPPLPPAARPAPARPPPLAPALPLATVPEANPFNVPAATTAPEARPFWAAAAVAPAPIPRLAFEAPAVAQRPVVQSVARPKTPRNLDDLPDFLDGRARSRRAVLIVFAVAILTLLGTIAAAIASNYRPS